MASEDVYIILQLFQRNERVQLNVVVEMLALLHIQEKHVTCNTNRTGKNICHKNLAHRRNQCNENRAQEHNCYIALISLSLHVHINRQITC
jgi:hypothetical protein